MNQKLLYLLIGYLKCYAVGKFFVTNINTPYKLKKSKVFNKLVAESYRKYKKLPILTYW